MSGFHYFSQIENILFCGGHTWRCGGVNVTGFSDPIIESDSYFYSTIYSIKASTRNASAMAFLTYRLGACRNNMDIITESGTAIIGNSVSSVLYANANVSARTANRHTK